MHTMKRRQWPSNQWSLLNLPLGVYLFFIYKHECAVAIVFTVVVENCTRTGT
jgi:hypothetical protein